MASFFFYFRDFFDIGQFVFAISMGDEYELVSCDVLLGGESHVFGSNSAESLIELKQLIVEHDITLLIYVMDGRNHTLDHALSGKFRL